MLWLRKASVALLLPFAELASAATPLQEEYYQQLSLARTHEFFFQSLPQWAMWVNLIAAAILYLVWQSQRNVPQFNWLLGASLTANASNLSALYPESLPPLFIDCLLSTWLYCLTRILFTHLTSTQQRWLSAVAAAVLISFGLARALGGDILHTALLSTAFGLLVFASALRLRQHIRTVRSPKMSLFIGVFILALCGLLDTLGILLNWQLAQTLLLSPFAQMIAVVLALYFLVTRHVNNQLQLSVLNATLDSRVREAERELEDRYRLITQDAVDTAALRERRNIYKSIHEDISDKLLQLIYRAPAPETADLARAALAELRDTQKLQPEQHRSVHHILADAFAEIQTRCEQVNLQLSWQVAPELETFTLNARQESALTRTLREAISNLFKHAQASEVAISFCLSETSSQDLHYTVKDNGIGIDPARPRGRGLANMQQRLEELGGQVTIDTRTGAGTSLLFTLPFLAEQSQ